MTTHARLRQVVDKTLTAYFDLQFYLSHGPETGVEDHAAKLDAAATEFGQAQEELHAVLAGV